MSVEMLLKPEVDSPRDINDNDLDTKHKYYTDKLGERKTTLVIPEPKRLSPLATALTPEIRHDRSTSPSIKSEVPVYPHLPWQSPYYPALPSPYSYFPYRLPAFPFPPYPEHLPFPPFPDHVRPCSSFGAMFSPMPFPHALSSFHFPIRHEKVLGLERKTIDSEDLKSMKRSYDSLSTGTRTSLPTKPEPLSPTRDQSGTTENDHKVTMDTTEPTKYQCSSCQKIYSTFSGLSKHRQFHCSQDLKKEFTCKYCDKTYVSLGALKMHIRTHTLPCKCKICGKAFSRPWLLQGHIRTHTGEKPFSCVHCLRAFADRSNLRAHLQTHSDVKKYSCKTCSKTFSRMSLLLKHEESCAGVDI